MWELLCAHCLQRGLNSRPLVYKTSALPLSYRGLMVGWENKVLGSDLGVLKWDVSKLPPLEH